MLRSTSARCWGVLTDEANCTMAGMPTPTVSSEGSSVYFAVVSGLSVRKDEVAVCDRPSARVTTERTE